MVWIVGRSGAGPKLGDELRDVRCLVWTDGSHQGVALGTRLPAEVADGPVILVAPLPVAAGGSAAVAPVDATRVHALLETCQACFPQVVRESLLLQRRAQQQDEEDEEDEERDEENNGAAKPDVQHAERPGDDMSVDDEDDDNDDDDEDDDDDGDEKNDLSTLATQVANEQRELRLHAGHAREDAASIETFSSICAKLGVAEDSEFGQALAASEYFGKQGQFLYLHCQATPGSGEYVSVAYTFQPQDQSRLFAPISTAPPLPGSENGQSPEDSILEPVTRRMDHKLYSIGAERLPGEVDGAGKNSEEMLKDMMLRHASGSCTVIVQPQSTPKVLMEQMLELVLPLPKTTNKDLRLRTIVGPYNTRHDLRFHLASN